MVSIWTNIWEDIKRRKKRLRTFQEEESYSWQYLMALLLSFGDAKKANYMVVSGCLCAIDTEMAFRRAVQYLQDRGCVPGLFSVLHRKNDLSCLDANVIETINRIQESSAEQVVKDIFDIFSLLSTPSRFQQSPRPVGVQPTIISKWYREIVEYTRRYKDFLTSQEDKTALWWKIFQFHERWEKIQNLLKEKRTNVTHAEVFATCEQKLQNFFRENPDMTDDFALSQTDNTGLTYETTRSFHFKLYESLKSHAGEPRVILFLEEQAKSGVVIAQLALGVIHEQGFAGTDPDLKKAAEYYKMALDQDNPEGLCAFAWFCKHGKGGVIKNEIEAFKLFKRAADQEPGLDEAQYVVGRDYYERRKYKEAAYYCEKAAKQGYAPALNVLACSFEELAKQSRKDEEKEDYKRKAFENYKRAEKQGFSFALEALGKCYAFGIGVEKNDVEKNRYYQLVFEKYKELANLGVSWAQLRVAKFYKEGRWYEHGRNDPSPPDLVQAKEFLTRAARNDYHQAMFELSKIASTLEEHLKWLEKAAFRGNFFAQFDFAKELIQISQKGSFLASNSESNRVMIASIESALKCLAIHYYEKSADNDFLPAIKALIPYCERGESGANLTELVKKVEECSSQEQRSPMQTSQERDRSRAIPQRQASDRVPVLGGVTYKLNKKRYLNYFANI